ncbi:lactate utilization protein [Candidatus Nanosalina sp. VS9-1]|uniref:lactate utilization protein n=1 Tax=Candidatus Nanosalina sp. VS9-1 TaxID=3388566 RepID=UPI0039E09F90
MYTKEDFMEDVDVDHEKFDSEASEDEIEEAVENLEANGFDVKVVDSSDEALEEIKGKIPEEASVMNGHSTTLEEIGFMEYLNEGDHDWESLPGKIWSIDDDEKRNEERRKATTADYFLGSVNGVAREDGSLVAADLSGSRIGAYPFAAGNVIIVTGVNKIVKDIEEARDRLWEYAYEFENERAQEEYGVESAVAKEFLYHAESGDRTTVILVKEKLGF